MLFLGLFVISCFLDDDDEYSESDEYGYDDSDDGQSDSSSSGSSALKSAEERNRILSEYFDTSAVREHKVSLKGNGDDKVTVLMYVNGSNLESESGEATEDISEVIKAGTCDNVNYLIQTMGTKSWDDELGIASDHSQRYRVTDDGLELLDDSLGQLDCTKASTLSDFIKWGAENYPADRYVLQFWDHGAGPVYGFGYDEWQDESDTLTIDEMKTALSDGGVYFDFIGMDCCIMSSMEVCMALYDYCDYAILSEEFESGLGWSYTGWVKALNANTSIDTPSLAQIAIDDNVNANEQDWDGDSACMALIDEAPIKVLYTAWTEFAYANEDTLLSSNYSQQVERSGRAHPALTRSRSGWGFGDEDYFSDFDDDAQLSDYYITDIMAVAQNIDSDEAKSLSAAVSGTILYSRSTSDDSYMTGLSVTLPYGDNDFYSQLKTVFTSCGIDDTYVSWLGKFVTAEGAGDFYNYEENWGDEWNGWEEYEEEYDWGEWDYSEDDGYWEDSDWGWDDYYYDDSYYGEYEDYPGDDYYYDDGYYDEYYDGAPYEDEYYYDDGYYEGGYYDEPGYEREYYYDDYAYDGPGRDYYEKW